MKKEVLIAIFLGLFLGGVLSLFIIKETTKNQRPQIKNDIKKEKGIITNKKNIDFQPLEILSPEEDLITDKNQIKIKIKLIKESLVIIQSPIKELAVYNKEEILTTEFPLSLGENIIEITVYPKDKTLPIQRKTTKVYYLKNEL